MSSRRPKRQREEKDDESASGQDPTRTIFTGWLDDGTRGVDGRVEHEMFAISLDGETQEVSIGDAVEVRCPPEDRSIYQLESDDLEDDNIMVARVEQIWEEPNGSTSPSGQSSTIPKFLARWFLKKSFVDRLSGESTYSSNGWEFSHPLTEHDLILSDQADENAVTTIIGRARLLYRRPGADANFDAVPTNAFVCRYSVSLESEDDSGTVKVVRFEGRNDDWSEILGTPRNSSRQDLERTDRDSADMPPGSAATSPSIGDDSDSESSYDQFRSGGVVDEGTGEKRDIRVGPDHQVTVPVFGSNQTVKSRQPTCVWKPGQVSEEDVRRYLTQAGQILVPFLQENQLTHAEPYSPLPWDRMEAIARGMAQRSLPTLSNVCTASSMSENCTDLLRECEVDPLMENFHNSNYDIEASLAAIKASPKKFLTCWTPEEKALLNAGFRRFAGSLKMAHKTIGPTMTFQDVIDYHYRFKIPDQYRLLRNEKQEQAVRMVEKAESRRNMDAFINVNQEPAAGELSEKRRAKIGEWYQTGVGGVTGALEERRTRAKSLLVAIENELGANRAGQVLQALSGYDRTSIVKLRDKLMSILADNEEFQQQILEFLPNQLHS